MLCAHIYHKLSSNASPTRLLAAPFQAAARPGELFAIEQPTARPHYPVSKVPAGTRNHLPWLQEFSHSVSS
jgi:hypothetical protein